jgi:hypothetical protein
VERGDRHHRLDRRLKERLIDAAGFARMVGDKSDELRAYYPAAVEFFNVYEAALRDAGAIDFADMVPLVTRAMAHDTACPDATVPSHCVT